VRRDLIPLGDSAFMEHVVEGLLRADFRERMEGYQLAIQNGVYSPDECRRLENRPARTDGKGGEYWRPSNMVGGAELKTPGVDSAQLPGDRPQHKWRSKIRSAMRIVASKVA